jgi:DNA-binding NtrC family response regulator
MHDVLLCSQNPILIRNLYGILRDEGHGVEIAEHPALAVQMALGRTYAAIIFDSDPFGLSVTDAIKIIKRFHPHILVIFVGYDRLEADSENVRVPADLEEFKRAIHDIPSLALS